MGQREKESWGIQQLAECWCAADDQMPTLRVSLLGNAKTSDCGFCFLTPVPQHHLRNQPWHQNTKTPGKKPGNTSEGEERLKNKLYSSLWFSVSGMVKISISPEPQQLVASLMGVNKFTQILLCEFDLNFGEFCKFVLLTNSKPSWKHSHYSKYEIIQYLLNSKYCCWIGIE